MFPHLKSNIYKLLFPLEEIRPILTIIRVITQVQGHPRFKRILDSTEYWGQSLQFARV